MTHPYPKDVVEAVAKALMKSSEGRDAFGAGGDWDAAGHTIKQEFLGHAETALQTLWDASRVDTVDQLKALPVDTVIKGHTGYIYDQWVDGWYRANDDRSQPVEVEVGELPAHIIFLGDAE